MAKLSTYKSQTLAQRILVFGAPKTGKTLLLGQLARDFKLLWFYLENGIDTLLNQLPPAYLENIEYVKIPDSPQNPCAVNCLLKFIESKSAGYICDLHGDWNCATCASRKSEFTVLDPAKFTAKDGWIIVIDSGTQFALSAFNHTCTKNNISLESGEKASFTIWGMQGVYIDKLFSMFQAGPWSCAITGHEVEVDMPDKSKKIAPSIGTRKVASNFGKYFDSVIRCSKAGSNFKVASLSKDAPMCEVGTRTNYDLNNPQIDICDFFKPHKDVGTTVTKVVVPQLGKSGSTAPAIPGLANFAAKAAQPKPN